VVLGYHQFGEMGEKGDATYRVTPAAFRSQLQWIKDHGWTPVSLGQVSDFYAKGSPLPAKSVLLTFDDGFRTIHSRAFPLMREFGYPGVLFLYTDFIKWQGGSLRYAEVEEMAKGGFAVGSHSVSHANLSAAGDSLGPQEFAAKVRHELEGSRDFLRERFGVTPRAYAYPFGVFHPEVTEGLVRAGYTLGFTVNPGPNDATVDPLLLRRELLTRGTGPGRFASFFATGVLHLEAVDPPDGGRVPTRTPVLTARILDAVDPASVEVRLGSKTLEGRTFDPATGVVRMALKTPLARGGHLWTVTAKGRDGTPRTYSCFFRIPKVPAEDKTRPLPSPSPEGYAPDPGP
jgi:peptidoglycan/xylan/chitin deacetylase (PgdA/CDA1 family)